MWGDAAGDVEGLVPTVSWREENKGGGGHPTTALVDTGLCPPSWGEAPWGDGGAVVGSVGTISWGFLDRPPPCPGLCEHNELLLAKDAEGAARLVWGVPGSPQV